MHTIEKSLRVGLLVAVVAIVVIAAPVLGAAIGRSLRRIFRSQPH